MDKILLATDLGEGSRLAFERACSLASSRAANLTIVHAVPGSGDEPTTPDADLDTLRSRIVGMAEEMAPAAAEVAVHISTQSPEDAILAVAEEWTPDLILLGSHGDPRLRDAVLGTTAIHVIRAAKAPVLVVQGPGEGGYQKIMAAIDVEEPQEGLLGLCASLVRNGEIIALNAYDNRPLDILRSDATLADRRSAQEARLQALLDAIAPSVDSGTRLKALAREGDVMTVITDTAREIEPDLIAISTHGRTGLSRIIHGSFAEYVLLWAPCDVLVMPYARAKSDS